MLPTPRHCTLAQLTNTYSHHRPVMTSKASPVPIQNAGWEYHGWPIDNLGIFYICQLDHRSALSCHSCWGWLSYVEEIMSNSQNQSLRGSCTESKLDTPYPSHSYFAI